MGALVTEYVEALRGLATADKASINFLTMLAEDHRDQAAGIAAAIEAHVAQARARCLLSPCRPPPRLPAARAHAHAVALPPPPCPSPQCPPAHKLPALYLVDCIIKNVGEPYKALFTPRLPKARDPAPPVACRAAPPARARGGGGAQRCCGWRRPPRPRRPRARAPCARSSRQRRLPPRLLQQAGRGNSPPDPHLPTLSRRNTRRWWAMCGPRRPRRRTPR
jgi:hypothetical protein